MALARRDGKDNFRFEKSCKFIGSLAVSLLKGEERQAFVNEKLLEMKDIGKGIPVIIFVTDEGIKILNEDRTAVKMAHGITRVLFSTCHPDRKLFAYVAKAPGLNGKVLTQAHMFKTTKTKHTQELSSSISRAFKIGFSRNTTKRVNKIDLFEKEAEEVKEVRNFQKKRWARTDMAHGHDNSVHAMRAQGQGLIQEAAYPGLQKIDNKAQLDKEMKERKNIRYDRNQEIKRVEPRHHQPEELVNVVAKPEKTFSPRQRVDVTIDNHVNFVQDPEEPLPPKRRLSSTRGRKFSKDSSSSESETIDTTKPYPQVGDDSNVPLSPNNDAKSDSLSEAWFGGDLISSKNDNKASENNYVQPITKFGSLSENASFEADNQHIENEYVNLDSANTTPKKTAKRRSRKRMKDIPEAYRMTLSEDQILKDSEWYQPGFSRSIAEGILQNRPVGAFFIRDSSSHPGCYVMTMKVTPQVKDTGSMNYLIIQDEDGLYHIKGFATYFPGLMYLVAHYSSIQEDIPCRLHLSSNNPLFRMEDEGRNDQMDGDDLDHLFDDDDNDDDDCDDDDYINFSTCDDICRELDELCFGEDT